MKKLLIVTHVDFWRGGAGHRARLSALIFHIKDMASITVVYFGQVNDADIFQMKLILPGITFVVLAREKLSSMSEYESRFKDFILENCFDIALIEYIEMSFVLPLFPPSTITVLDTHDLLSDKIVSFKKNNLAYSGIELDQEDEFEIFSYFDFVIVIQQSDYVKVSEKIEKDKVLLIPHGVKFQRKEVNHIAKNIVFVGSEYSPNVDGLIWFLDNVWPYFNDNEHLNFNIYGNVCKKIPGRIIEKYPRVYLNGYVENIAHIYNNCDIVVNPVKCGAGLKIKNVEALAQGFPLVTTTHGASGIEHGSGSCFLIADTPEQFNSWILSLTTNYELRVQISMSAFDFANTYFNQEKCFSPLANILSNN